MKKYKRIYIEITNICNLSCSFCPPDHRKKMFMPVANFKHILEAIKGHGDYIYLHIKGEPLLHPELDALLQLCHNQRLNVNITTNGTLLKKQKDLLLSAPAVRQISVSLQSFEDEDLCDGLQAYMDEILEVVEMGVKNTAIIFELRLWNYHAIENSKSETKNRLILEIMEKHFNTTVIRNFSNQQTKGFMLAPQVYLSQNEEFQWPNIAGPMISEVGTCYGLRQQVGILVNGDVVPCCLDSEGDCKLGNIFMNSFNEIIEGEKVKGMVRGFENNRIVDPLCQRCGYRSRFTKH